MNTINEQIAAADNWICAAELAALSFGIAKGTDQYQTLMMLCKGCYLSGKLAGITQINASMDKTYAAVRQQYPVATGKEIET